jgi:class 3 adenylate cyclase
LHLIIHTASGISNAAKGGQTLMCEATFKMVKDMGKELARVDPSNQLWSARIMMRIKASLLSFLKAVW